MQCGKSSGMLIIALKTVDIKNRLDLLLIAPGFSRADVF